MNNNLKRYYDNPILFDIVIVCIVGVLLYLSKPYIKTVFLLPTSENVNNFCVSLITVSATLLGFLLTIITVIVTFKKGFEDNQQKENFEDSLDNMPRTTIFDKKISKEEKFYGTEIHKKVVHVFIISTYEISIVLLILLLLQFNVISVSLFHISFFNICLLLFILLSVSRSLYIFKLFLNVHLNDGSSNHESNMNG